ncbi:MAG TPA: C-type lectin domain-containing protein [Kofleriaceae bacterium]|nr:C-type lectin domain-containing protein [Kofleriaceae bacterium]
MRYAFVLVLAGCNAHLGSDVGPNVIGADGNTADSAHVTPDASPDARACAGGDAHASDGTNCFLYFATPKTWAQAKAACDALPAHLAKISNAAQNTLVAQLSLNVDSFIGATDAVTEGTFLWEDGTPLAYMNFRTGEPNNGSGQYQEDCLVLAGKKSVDGWDDRPCSTGIVLGAGSYPYVCED